eukprot:CAMPEP_0205804944 /NCGR_PEP_ID=MMETSP0205-20121125/7999_1 /ASSEMBLY_ACC=CAM_ASM_000278 /TAXON_ID=36767 /ORGANISM="Euplotes focardii, Strain TN1" /LENGTH=202 /DNA_ID=CAMNT_0053075331 /DNA_START=207 /DNA_END=815 /DNA_ORIENTATION=+
MSHRPSSTKKLSTIKMKKAKKAEKLLKTSIDQSSLSRSKLKIMPQSNRISKIYVAGNMPKLEAPRQLAKRKISNKNIRMLTTCSPFIRSTISDSKIKKSKIAKQNKVKIPENNIPTSLVSRLMGVLEDSAKGVKKNLRKGSYLGNIQNKRGSNYMKERNSQDEGRQIDHFSPKSFDISKKNTSASSKRYTSAKKKKIMKNNS